MLLDKKSKILLSVERALNDLRKGLPIIIAENNKKIIASSPETVSNDLIINISKNHKIRLTITNNRLNFINNTSAKQDCNHTIPLQSDTIEQIPQLCGLKEISNINEIDNIGSSKLEDAAIEISRTAELIPAMITSDFDESYNNDNLSLVSPDEIREYKEIISLELTEACRTKLVLKNSINCEIIAYRPNIGGKEHYAIIVGNIPDTPIVRVHSSCYTGDLLDSLACDCHDQLHTSIELMNKEGGGIVLYMLQEGRGIGLINKLRAYAQKEKGFDTVDANESLGFNDDERPFEPAAAILKKLNIKEVQLLSNNPRKSKGLENCGIRVVKCVPHIMETNEHNESYIKTKSERLGHNIKNNN